MRSPFVVVSGLFVLSGGLLLARQVIGLGDPAFQDPVITIDYVAAWLGPIAGVISAAVLLLWWRITPIQPGSWLLLVGGGALALTAVGRLMTNVFDMEFLGDQLQTVDLVGAVTIGLAGALASTVTDRYRWSGLFLLAFAFGVGLPGARGLWLAGGSLIGMGYWLTITRARDEEGVSKGP